MAISTSKYYLILCIVIGFVLGFVITSLILLALNTDEWYKKVNAIEHKRIMLVNHEAEKTVTFLHIKGDKLSVSYEW